MIYKNKHELHVERKPAKNSGICSKNINGNSSELIVICFEIYEQI